MWKRKGEEKGSEERGGENITLERNGERFDLKVSHLRKKKI